MGARGGFQFRAPPQKFPRGPLKSSSTVNQLRSPNPKSPTKSPPKKRVFHEWTSGARGTFEFATRSQAVQEPGAIRQNLMHEVGTRAVPAIWPVEPGVEARGNIIGASEKRSPG